MRSLLFINEFMEGDKEIHMQAVKMTELKCPSCKGWLKADRQSSDIEVCQECNARYFIQWNYSEETGKEELELKPVPQRIAYKPIQREEPKKTGWEPYGWKRGVALVILFFVLMGIMYGPKIYRRYQMDHGGYAAEMENEPEDKQIDQSGKN